MADEAREVQRRLRDEKLEFETSQGVGQTPVLTFSNA